MPFKGRVPLTWALPCLHPPWARRSDAVINPVSVIARILCPLCYSAHLQQELDGAGWSRWFSEQHVESSVIHDLLLSHWVEAHGGTLRFPTCTRVLQQQESLCVPAFLTGLQPFPSPITLHALSSFLLHNQDLGNGETLPTLSTPAPSSSIQCQVDAHSITSQLPFVLSPHPWRGWSL